MCGIAGIVGQRENYNAEINQMVLVQGHRGPDAHGIFCGSHIALGHNRLSIIDLDASANQPFHSSCNRYVMVFNGEIYNYKDLKSKLPGYSFHTNSDTEVLLALYIKYGTSMLEMLNGMFAFAIWDSLEEKLFCARDRFGVKPFYYTHQNGEFIFASEIKALQKTTILTELNQTVLADYLVFGSYGFPAETFWENVSQLPGGSYLQYDFRNQKVKEFIYYDFVGRVNEIEPSQSLEDLKKMYSELLYDSVSLRFIADVPVGFNLSGGLDSSLLVAFVNKTNAHIKEKVEAYTFYTGHAEYDELPWVELLLKQGGNPLQKVKLSVEDVPRLAEETAYFQDEPFGGFPTIAYSQLFKVANQKGVKVLLDGQGMDESWGGYDYYRSSSEALVQGTTTSLTRPNVFEEEFLKNNRELSFPKPFESKIKNLQYRDLFFTKIPRALRFNDRTSMQHSVELREPFLDYRLVELAFAQFETFKIKDNVGKWFLREFAKDILPKQLSFAPKRPLQTPQREWLRTELKSWAEGHIHQLAKADFVNPIVLLNEWGNYLKGYSDNSFYVWQWINLNIILNTRKVNGIK